MSTWPTLPVRRLFSLVNGGTPTADGANWGGDVPWATPVDLAQVHGGVLEGTDRTLTELGLRSGSRAVPAGSLVLSTRAPIGYVAESPVRTAFNQGCRGLSPTAPLTLRYFRYQFTSLTDRLQACGQGSTFVELSRDALAAFPLVVPPLAAQRAIANYLDRETARIDALIAAGEKTVDLLEERWRRELHDAFDPSWPQTPLKYVVHINPENLPEDTLPDYEFKYVDIASTGRGQLIEEPREMTFEIAPSRARRVLRVGDTILSTVRTYLRASWTVRQQQDDLVASTGFACLRPSERMDPRFLGWLAASDIVVEEVVARSVGVSYPAINTSDLGTIGVPCPPLDVQEEAADLLDAARREIDVIVETRKKMIALLRERRQALVSAAVTGQLDIPEAA